MASDIKVGLSGGSDTNSGTNNLKGMTGDGSAEMDILNDVGETSEADDSTDESETSEEVEEPADEQVDDTESDDNEETDESDDEVKDDETEDDAEVEEVDNLYKAIKKGDPKLLQKYPELKDVLLRERKFTELFATPEQAKYSAARTQLFGAIEKDITSGNVEPLLKTLKGVGNGESLALFAQGMIKSLQSVDSDLYSEIAAVPLKQAIRFAYKEGQKNKNEYLWKSAINLHEFIFGDRNLQEDPKFTKTKPEVHPEVDELKKQLSERDQRQYNSFRGDVVEIVNHRANSIISANLEGIELTPYQKKNIIRDINTELEGILQKDVRYQASMKSFWDQAMNAGLTTDWKNRISTSVIAKVKQVLPLARKKVLDEAGFGNNKTKPRELKRISPTNTTSKTNTNIDFSKVDRKATSDRDILSDDPRRIKMVKQ